MIRFLPAPTGRHVLDFSQKSVHVDACMSLVSLEDFAELLAGCDGRDQYIIFSRFH